MNRLLLLFTAAAAFHCAAADQLTPAELSKIDAHLQPVLQGGMPTGGDCAASVDNLGLTRYRIIIRGNAEDIRGAGIPVESALGDILTAVVGVEQIRTLAHLSSVRSIECGAINYPQ